MTVVDRTDELIRAMLARRAERPIPTWLLDHSLEAVATARQARGVRAWPPSLPSTTTTRVAMVATLALVPTALVVGALIAGAFTPRPATPEPSHAAVIGSSTPGQPVTTPGAPSSEASAGTSSEPRTPTSSLLPGSLAIVTGEGDRLRVRSAPGVGTDSKKLAPVLPAGTRMLIVDGPVDANGYAWYEVQTDVEPVELYGWVASGHDGVAWIEPATPSCWNDLDEMAVARVHPIDFLVCYHGLEVTLIARRSEIGDGAATGDCRTWTGHDVPCDMQPGWLFGDDYFTYEPDGQATQRISVAIPPALEAALQEVRALATVSLTIAMDAPEASACRIVDPGSGRDLVPRNHVITACQMRFVVRHVAG